MLSTHWTEPYQRPDFQIFFCPVITMDVTFTHMGSRINLLGTTPTAQDILLYSCEKQVTDLTPPSFIVASSDDGLVRCRIASLTTNHSFVMVLVLPSSEQRVAQL